MQATCEVGLPVKQAGRSAALMFFVQGTAFEAINLFTSKIPQQSHVLDQMQHAHFFFIRTMTRLSQATVKLRDVASTRSFRVLWHAVPQLGT